VTPLLSREELVLKLLLPNHHQSAPFIRNTLGKWQQYWKEQLGNWYGMLFHEGQFLDR
jgi:hypothetical protein